MSKFYALKFDAAIDQNLHQLVAGKRILDERYSLKILEDLTRAVVHAHSRGFAFRNLSAKNVGFDQDNL
jgi:hypothetical protein